MTAGGGPLTRMPRGGGTLDVTTHAELATSAVEAAKASRNFLPHWFIAGPV
jgi:hypothetical protein